MADVCALTSKRRVTKRVAVLVGALVLSGTLGSCTSPDPEEHFRAPSQGGGPGIDAGGGSAGHVADAAIEDLGMPDGLRACGDAPVPTGTFSRQALRAAAADCASWQHCEFENRALWLDHLVRKYVEAPSDARLGRVREAFVDAMVRWSELELYQFGPAASPAPTAGRDVYQGQSYRDRIYAWPTTARCRVEEQVVGRDYEDGFDRIPISGRGLYGLEYTLFYEGDDTDCLAGSASATEWEALSADALAAGKLAYAEALAEGVLSHARTLSVAWSDDAGSFRDTFVSASGYPDEQEAMNVLAWSLTYIDKELKDWKLGIPAGYTLTSPVREPETPHVRVGTETLRTNLRGFRSLFQGCGADGAGIGFDDWLDEAGHGSLADDMVAALEDAEAALDALPPLHEASTSEIDAAYQAVRVLTTLMKSELLGPGSPLNLQLPATLEGDTD